MEIHKENIWTGWMTWEQIEPFKEQIIDMELEEMIVFHYPEMDIPRSYPEQKVAELQQHLANGNTYFWGALYQGKLLGYHWAYVANFIDHLRWNARSSMFLPEARGLNLGTMAYQSAIHKAEELGCSDMAAMYVPSNGKIEHMFKKNGYKVSRIEVVKELENPDPSAERGVTGPFVESPPSLMETRC